MSDWFIQQFGGSKWEIVVGAETGESALAQLVKTNQMPIGETCVVRLLGPELLLRVHQTLHVLPHNAPPPGEPQ